MTPVETPIFGPYNETLDGDQTLQRKYLMVPPSDIEAINKKLQDDAHYIGILDKQIKRLEQSCELAWREFDSVSRCWLQQRNMLEIASRHLPAPILQAMEQAAAKIEMQANTTVARAIFLKEQLKQLATDPLILRIIGDYFHDEEWEYSYNDVADAVAHIDHDERHRIGSLMRLGFADYIRRPAPADAKTENDIEEWHPIMPELPLEPPKGSTP